jgi:hypothetical protein
VSDELGLRERPLELERATEADAGRDLLEELVDRVDTNGLEHLLAVLFG